MNIFNFLGGCRILFSAQQFMPYIYNFLKTIKSQQKLKGGVICLLTLVWICFILFLFVCGGFVVVALFSPRHFSPVLHSVLHNDFSWKRIKLEQTIDLIAFFFFLLDSVTFYIHKIIQLQHCLCSQ